MRMRKKKNAESRMNACSAVKVENPKELKGKWDEVYGKGREMYLEIGCGKGTFVTELAKRNPDNFYVAIEVVPDVIMLAMEKAKSQELKNVKFATEEVDGISYLTVDFYVVGEEKTFFGFIGQTFSTAMSYCAIVFRSLIDLITGKYGISAMSGPVGVTATIGAVAKQSILDLIPIMALITINLGLFNLLPLPALDGGRLVFILFEMIFRKPVPQKYESIVHAVGIILLLTLMAVISFKDIYVLITG